MGRNKKNIYDFLNIRVRDIVQKKDYDYDDTNNNNNNKSILLINQNNDYEEIIFKSKPSSNDPQSPQSSPQSSSQQQQQQQNQGTEEFGNAVAMQNNKMIVGAPYTAVRGKGEYVILKFGNVIINYKQKVLEEEDPKEKEK